MILSKWELRKLGEACDVIMGQSPPGSSYNKQGDGIPFFQGKADFGKISPTVTIWCRLPKKIAEPNDILISVRAPVGPTNMCNLRCCIGRGLTAIRTKEQINPKFVLYYLRSIESDIVSLGTGSTFQAISKSQIANLEIPVAPLTEQHSIVSEIEKQFSRLDEAVTALKRIKANLKRYKASVLKAAVEGKLTEEWRKENVGAGPRACPDKKGQPQGVAPTETGAELLKRILAERRKKWEKEHPGKKYKEPAVPDKSNMPELPKEWVWASADQCTNLITDGEHITPQRSSSGIYLLSARNIHDGKLVLDDVDYISEQVYDKLSQRFLAAPGDVLLSCSGSVGRSCVVPDHIKFSLVRSVAILKPILNMGYFISYALRSLLLQSQIEEKKTQTAQANIFQGKIRSLVFPVPPLNEQKIILEEIESHLSVAEEIETEVETNLKRAERLRQSILKKAFSGRLVQQEASYKLAGD